MRFRNFLKQRTFSDQALENRVGVNQVEGTGAGKKGFFNIAQELTEPGLGQGMEQEDYQRLLRKDELRGITTNEFEAAVAPAVRGGGAGDVLLGHPMQLRQQFDSYEASEGVLGGDEKCTAFSRADVYEGETAEIDLEDLDDLVE